MLFTQQHANRVLLLCVLQSACSDPECRENERKIGKTCIPLSAAPDGAASPARADDGSSDGAAHQSASQFELDASTLANTGKEDADASLRAIDNVSPDAQACSSAITACEEPANCDANAHAGNPCESGAQVVGLSVGSFHACAVLSTGAVKCWGRNDKGQLGIDGGTDMPPTAVVGLANVVEVAAGDQHTCARLADGSVHCWGDNQFGQLGSGSNGSSSDATAAVPGLTGVVHVSAGGKNTCVVRDSAPAVLCWGGGSSGGIVAGSPAPTEVKGLSLTHDLSVGYDHICALSALGEVSCWGDDGVGQLGGGQTQNGSATPVVAVGAPARALQVASGAAHTCAVLSDSTVSCWGSDYYGQLGDGNNSMPIAAFPSPRVIPSFGGVRAVSAGNGFSCALMADGTVSCWGKGGVLGTGTMDAHSSPTAVPGIQDALELRSGIGFSCARLRSGQVQCWGGSNGYQQLGDGTLNNRLSPVVVLDLP